MEKGKLKILENNNLAFYCPGCQSYHIINDKWSFNEDYDKPTFSPSILVQAGHYITGYTGDCWCTYNKEHLDDPAPFECYRCHSFITNGKIQFLSDCTHSLVGETVNLRDEIDFRE